MRLALAAFASLLAGPALAGSMTVNLDQSVRLNLAAPARDVVVSNPAVADVSMLTPTSLVVLGRGYGVTNLMVVDAAGRTVLDRDIVVSSADTNWVSVYRGPSLNNYACAGRCERTPLPSEADQVYKSYSPPYTDYADRAKEAGNVKP